jgi:glycosyltransferase involved in cell wall biosynthesis
MAAKSLKVLVFPRDWNPYQELLYTPMRSDVADPVNVAYSTRNHIIWPVVIPLTWLIRRAMGYRVLHVHWMTLQFKAPVPFRKPLSYGMYRAMFSLARRIGLTIVWTVHNVLPHEPQTSDDRDIAGRLSRQSRAKIVHSSNAIAQMREQGLDTVDVTVIPHGNYIGVYPAGISRTAARERFGFALDDTVVLFFGNMRAYKGVDELRAAWPGLEGPGRKLILAGDCPDPDLRARLAVLARSSSVQVVYDRVPDADVAAYLLAADIVCAPFKAVRCCWR